MMTNKQKQRAEEIRQELAPLCKECQKVAKIYSTAGANYGAAYRVRFAWQTVGNSGHARDLFGEEEAQKMETMRRDDPHEWHAQYKKAIEAEHEAQGKEEPQRLTVAKYRATLKKLKELEAKAEKIAKESRETVRAAGLYGHEDFITHFNKSK